MTLSSPSRNKTQHARSKKQRCQRCPFKHRSGLRYNSRGASLSRKAPRSTLQSFSGCNAKCGPCRGSRRWGSRDIHGSPWRKALRTLALHECQLRLEVKVHSRYCVFQEPVGASLRSSPVENARSPYPGGSVRIDASRGSGPTTVRRLSFSSVRNQRSTSHSRSSSSPQPHRQYQHVVRQQVLHRAAQLWQRIRPQQSHCNPATAIKQHEHMETDAPCGVPSEPSRRR